MPLQYTSMRLLAVASRSSSVLCPCHQCNSDHFVAFALLYISAQCLRYAIQGSAKPLRLNTNHCNALAIQLISIHRHCGSNRCSSNLRLSQSSRILSPPCRRVAVHFSTLPLLNVAVPPVALAEQLIALPLLIRASPHHSQLRHCDSMLVSAFALQFRALHIFATALHIDAVRCHCFDWIHHASPLPSDS